MWLLKDRLFNHVHVCRPLTYNTYCPALRRGSQAWMSALHGLLLSSHATFSARSPLLVPIVQLLVDLREEGLAEL